MRLSPPSEAGTHRSRFVLILGSFRPVVRGHIPDPVNLGSGEDHHPLAPLVGEEDGLTAVVDLGDAAGRLKAEEGAGEADANNRRRRAAKGRAKEEREERAELAPFGEDYGSGGLNRAEIDLFDDDGL